MYDQVTLWRTLLNPLTSRTPLTSLIPFTVPLTLYTCFYIFWQSPIWNLTYFVNVNDIVVLRLPAADLTPTPPPSPRHPPEPFAGPRLFLPSRGGQTRPGRRSIQFCTWPGSCWNCDLSHCNTCKLYFRSTYSAILDPRYPALGWVEQ